MISLNFQDPAPNNFLGQHIHPNRLMSKQLPRNSTLFSTEFKLHEPGWILHYPINTVCRFAGSFASLFLVQWNFSATSGAYRQDNAVLYNRGSTVFFWTSFCNSQLGKNPHLFPLILFIFNLSGILLYFFQKKELIAVVWKLYLHVSHIFQGYIKNHEKRGIPSLCLLSSCI